MKGHGPGRLARITRGATRLCLGLSALATPALAAWPNGATSNLPVCTESSNQWYPVAVSDDAGGMIVAWNDARVGMDHLYAQHVLASGEADSAWPAGGRAICLSAGGKSTLSIISDGAGGAIVTWSENSTAIYSQHVLPSGTVDPGWPVDGLLVAAAPSLQFNVESVPDGAGGVVMAWQDGRNGGYDIYAHHVLSSGTTDPAWPAQGRAICSASNPQYYPMLTSDGAGGAVITWYDFRTGDYDIYAQHVLNSGAIDPAWPVDGRLICGAPSIQYIPTIVSDDAGGGVIVWLDHRGGSSYDVYAQHVLGNGALDPAWPENGRGLCVGAGGESNLVAVSDMAGGLIAAWHGIRMTGVDIIAQHVLASGEVDPAWPANGRTVCAESHTQQDVVIASDGSEGAIVLWHDLRGDDLDLYAQHVSSSGDIDPTWPNDGRPVCSAATAQYSNARIAVADGAGGVLAVWEDDREGTDNKDIYAQRVARHGRLGTPEAEITLVADVPNDEGGFVEVTWRSSYVEGDSSNPVIRYDVFRLAPDTSQEGEGEAWELVASVNATSASTYACHSPTVGDSSAAGLPIAEFKVRSTTAGVEHWDSRKAGGYSVDNIPPATGIDQGDPRAALQLTAPSPNPASLRTVLRFELPRALKVRLAVFDATGRVVRELTNGELGAGQHAAEWDLQDAWGRAVRAGLYFVQLETELSRQVRRLAVTR